jgi:deoxyribose-phosphate aldolase
MEEEKKESEITGKLSKYKKISYTEELIKERLEALEEQEHKYDNLDSYKTMLSLIDLTTLNTQDTDEKVIDMCKKVNGFKSAFPALPNVGAICVYPPFASVVKANLTAEHVGIASVSACFPSSQSFLKTKLLETQLVIKDGATEIDIVISVGKFLEGKKEEVYNEIYQIKKVAKDQHLKVILETGALKDPQLIREASLVAMEAGADFIKTSTGKMDPPATPMAMLVMCDAIKEFNEVNEKKIGIKPAGGIATPQDAQKYFTLVVETLGDQYASNKLFRIGASRLANNLLHKILTLQVQNSKYF